MKARSDFVTNSSSSSFIISKKRLNNNQIVSIKNHFEIAKKMGIVDLKWDYPYQIEENEDCITGYVYMDNFDMRLFLDKIGVKEEDVEWGEYPFNIHKEK